MIKELVNIKTNNIKTTIIIQPDAWPAFVVIGQSEMNTIVSENDQVTFCCLLQHNFSCGRGQNHQAYKQGIL